MKPLPQQLLKIFLRKNSFKNDFFKKGVIFKTFLLAKYKKYYKVFYAYFFIILIMKLTHFFKLNTFKENLSQIIQRFPLGVIFICIITILLFVLTRGELTQMTENYLLRIIFSLILTFFFSLWVSYVSENHKCKLSALFLQVLPLLFGFLFYLTFKANFDNFDNTLYFILSWVWIAWFLFIAPFLKKVVRHFDLSSQYYNYFYHISRVFLISGILGGALFWLGMIAISAVFTLFDINWSYSNFYSDWAILALSFFAPIFALTQLPKTSDFTSWDVWENKFFSFLIQYIWIPFISIYFVILYAYSIKVLVSFNNWPKWEVSWMVIWFSVFWYLIYIFSSLLEKEKLFIKYFKTLFPFVVIPQIFMLFYAIYLRIAQYDLTINRYFVVVFGMWLLVLSLYFIISKKKQIYMIPAVLTLFTFVISLGPWGVYSYPETRQFHRLKNNLIQANILQNGKIIPLQNDEDIDINLSKEIYGGISYLCDYDNCESIKTLFSDIYNDLYTTKKAEFEKNKLADLENWKGSLEQTELVKKRTYSGPSSWEIIDGIATTLKVRSYVAITPEEAQSEILYFYFGEKGQNSIFPISTQWYNTLYKIDLYSKEENSNFIYDIHKKTLEVKHGEMRETLDLTPVIDNLLSFYSNTKTTTFFKKNSLYHLKWAEHEYTLILEGISIENPFFKNQSSASDQYINTLNGYLLEK